VDRPFHCLLWIVDFDNTQRKEGVRAAAWKNGLR
jgi:hypothetical protein